MMGPACLVVSIPRNLPPCEPTNWLALRSSRRAGAPISHRGSPMHSHARPSVPLADGFTLETSQNKPLSRNRKGSFGAAVSSRPQNPRDLDRGGIA